MEILCAVIMAFAAVISCGAPYLAFWMSVVAFAILFATKLDAKKEQKGLDFGQEWDYDTASRRCHEKICKKNKSYDLRLQRLASQIANEEKNRVLSKMASGEESVWIYVGWNAENRTFRRFFQSALECGEVEYACPFYLSVKIKEFVM